MSEVWEQNTANESGRLIHEYMERAARARALGDNMLGLHLFLAAYGQAAVTGHGQDPEAISALREAWALALQLKERSLAEYIFEKLEPSLSGDEIKACSESLQGLALDKLEEYGISRKDLEGVSEMIARELKEGPGDFSLDGGTFTPLTLFSGLPVRQEPVIGGVAQASEKDKKDNAADREPRVATEPRQEANAEPSAASAKEGEAATSAPVEKMVVGGFMPNQGPLIRFQPAPLRYADLAGYANAIRIAKSLGIGQERDPRYTQLVKELNAAHGLSEPPAFDPIVITAPVREDASRFAFATVGEMDLPVFRMYVEDNPQGLQALCVSVQQTPHFKFDRKTGLFEGKGVLLLEDIDLWEIPNVSEPPEEGMNPFIAAQISRSVREVYNFIRTAVEDPNVSVLVTCESDEDLSPFFLSLLEPYQTVDIEMPSAGERASIWMKLVAEHPSLSSMSVASLVKNSANMARYDIYMAAADALDESYRDDLNSGVARPVKASRLFEKLAAYQPLDSEEYKTLEDAIVSDFRSDLAHIDDLLDS